MLVWYLETADALVTVTVTLYQLASNCAGPALSLSLASGKDSGH